MSARAVWVTGLGVVSAAGAGTESLGALLREGGSAVRAAPEAGGVPAGSAPTPRLGREHRHLDRSAKLFVAAAEEAWRDAGLDAEPSEPQRCGVIEGSSLGSLSDVLTLHRERVVTRDARPPRPSALVRFMPGAGGAALAHAHKL